MTGSKEGVLDDICLKCVMGKCEHVMIQTFRTNEAVLASPYPFEIKGKGKYWQSYYCALTGWELTDKPSSISRESCSRYMPEIKYPKEG